jgi:phage-related protein
MVENFMATFGANIREFMAAIRQVDTAVRDAATGAQIDITADIVEFERQSRQVANEVRSLENRAVNIPVNVDTGDATRQLWQLQREIRNMHNEMKLANQRAMMPFRRNLLEVERDMYKLANNMGDYAGSTRDFMNEVNKLGSRQKKATDAMINADTSLRASMIQTAGAMMNMSTQASKISANYKRMANPMYMVNRAGLAVADSLNQIANRGNAAVLALKMLGPNASMKQLYDMQTMINQGLMRFQTVAIAALASSALLYGGLHKAAMGNEEYANSFNTMVASLKKAFEPMVQVFSAVMMKVYDFITTIANMIIKFNEAHPVLAKFIQGFLMLIPALTLILSPLAIGIGMFNGMLAAFSSICAMISPLVTGLAAMSGTVLLVGIAIAGLTAGIMALWNNCEGFRTAVQGIWDAIYTKISETVNTITTYVQNVWGQLVTWWEENHVKLKETTDTYWGQINTAIQEALSQIQITIGDNTVTIEKLWEDHGGKLKQFTDGFWKTIAVMIAIYLKNIVSAIEAALKMATGFFQATWPIISGIVEVAWNAIQTIVEVGTKFVQGTIKAVMKAIHGDWKGAWNEIKSTAQDIWNSIKSFFDRVDLVQTGKNIIQGLIRGIKSMRDAVKNAVDDIVRNIKSSIQGALQIHSPSRWMRDMVGKNIVSGVIVGINSMENQAYKASAAMAEWFKPELDTATMSVQYAGLDVGGQMDSLKRQIEQKLDVELWVDQEKKINAAQSDGSRGDLILEIDGYELARIQRDHLDGLNGTHTRLKLMQMGYRV